MIRLKDYYFELKDRIMRRVWRLSSSCSRINGIVLMYHHVATLPSSGTDTCVCSADEFRLSLEKISSAGYVFVTMDDAMRMIRVADPTPFCVVTFDDVPQDMYYNAYPLLKERAIPFTLFLTVEFVDKDGYLSAGQISEMVAESLCTLGSHSLSHPSLRDSKDSWSEISDSKRILENLFNKPIRYFAYPYGKSGSVSRRVIQQAKKAGYDCAFGTIAANLSMLSSKSLYYLPRIVGK